MNLELLKMLDKLKRTFIIVSENYSLMMLLQV